MVQKAESGKTHSHEVIKVKTREGTVRISDSLTKLDKKGKRMTERE